MRKLGRLGQSNARPPFTVQDGSQKGSKAFRPLLCKKKRNRLQSAMKLTSTGHEVGSDNQ